MRNAGMPTKKPIAKPIAAETGRVRRKFQPWSTPSHAVTYAPSPKKKLCPIETCPLYPMMIIRPRIATL